MPAHRTGLDGSGYLSELRDRVIEELPITFAEIAWAVRLTGIQADPILHAAAATDIKISANKTGARKLFLIAGERSLFAAAGKFL